MRTQKQIDKLIRENDYFYPEDDEEEVKLGPCGPCWEVNIDKEKDKLFFRIDNKEVLSYSLSKIKFALNREKLNELIGLLKKGDLKVLKKELGK